MRRDPGPFKAAAKNRPCSRGQAGRPGWGAGHWPGHRGMALVTALFLMLVLGLLAAAMVVVTSIQQTSASLDLRGDQAYQAATAALEWGTYQVLRANNCPASTALPLGPAMGGLTAVVQCSQVPAGGVQENGTGQVSLYVVTATASGGAVGTSDYVERQVQATLSRCTSNPSLNPAAVC